MCVRSKKCGPCSHTCVEGIPEVLGHASNSKLVVGARTEWRTPWLGGGILHIGGNKFNIGIECSLHRSWSVGARDYVNSTLFKMKTSRHRFLMRPPPMVQRHSLLTPHHHCLLHCIFVILLVIAVVTAATTISLPSPVIYFIVVCGFLCKPNFWSGEIYLI